MRRSALLLSAALLSTLTIASPAFAEDEEIANDSFDRGVELFRARKYRESAEAFTRAERVAPRGPTAYNAARAWKAAGEIPRAADELTQALFLGNLSDEQRRDATRQLTQMEQNLGVLDLEGPKDARVRVGTADERSLPAHVHVVPGSMPVVFRTPTATDEQTAKVGKGERVALKMRVAANAPGAPPSGAPPPAAPAGPARSEAAPSPTTSTGHTVGRVELLTRKNVGIATIVVGGILFATGVYVGFDGLDARDRFVSTGQHNKSLRDQAESERIWANVLGIVGLGAAGLGTYLLLTPGSSSATPATHGLRPSNIALGMAPGGVALTGELP